MRVRDAITLLGSSRCFAQQGTQSPKTAVFGPTPHLTHLALQLGSSLKEGPETGAEFGHSDGTSGGSLKTRGIPGMAPWQKATFFTAWFLVFTGHLGCLDAGTKRATRVYRGFPVTLQAAASEELVASFWLTARGVAVRFGRVAPWRHGLVPQGRWE